MVNQSVEKVWRVAILPRCGSIRQNIKCHTPQSKNRCVTGHQNVISYNISKVPKKMQRMRCSTSLVGSIPYSSPSESTKRHENRDLRHTRNFKVLATLKDAFIPESATQLDEIEQLNSFPPSSPFEENAKPNVIKTILKGGREYHCTSDELHFVKSGDWNLALWRYLPNPKAPKRVHPVLLLSGIATNALSYDLDPSISLARHLASLGFDTWTLEVRGMGFSHVEKSGPSEKEPSGTSPDAQEVLQKLQKSAIEFESSEDEFETSDSNSNLNSNSNSNSNSNEAKKLPQLKGLLSDSQRSAISYRISKMLEKYGPWSVPVTPPKGEGEGEGEAPPKGEGVMAGLRARMERLLSQSLGGNGGEKVGETRGVWEDIVGKVGKIVFEAQEEMEGEEGENGGKLRGAFEWDFDTLLFEDLPAALDYVGKVGGKQGENGGKVLGVGHSMGGILLYARLAITGPPDASNSTSDPNSNPNSNSTPDLDSNSTPNSNLNGSLSGVVTVASAMDYTSTFSSFRLLLPLEAPVRMSSVRTLPVRTLARAALPLIVRAPYSLAWVGENISRSGMMEVGLFRKLLRGNFESIPVRLMLQLASLFRGGGLRDRSGKVQYSKGLKDCTVPVLALAGDKDPVCPPQLVKGTVDMFPEGSAQWVQFGGKKGEPSFSHYDLLVTKQAKEEVFPLISNFLVEQDGKKQSSKEELQ